MASGRPVFPTLCKEIKPLLEGKRAAVRSHELAAPTCLAYDGTGVLKLQFKSDANRPECKGVMPTDAFWSGGEHLTISDFDPAVCFLQDHDRNTVATHSEFSS